MSIDSILNNAVFALQQGVSKKVVIGQLYASQSFLVVHTNNSQPFSYGGNITSTTYYVSSWKDFNNNQIPPFTYWCPESEVIKWPREWIILLLQGNSLEEIVNEVNYPKAVLEEITCNGILLYENYWEEEVPEVAAE